MKNTEIKKLVNEVAEHLAAQEFVLSHEFAFSNKSRLDKSLLYTSAENLAAYALALVQAAQAIENREMN